MNDLDDFTSVKERLNQIVEQVSDESIPLDEALSLYEEAMKLGLRACDLSEKDIFPETPSLDETSVSSDTSSPSVLEQNASTVDIA